MPITLREEAMTSVQRIVEKLPTARSAAAAQQPSQQDAAGATERRAEGEAGKKCGGIKMVPDPRVPESV